MVPQFRYQLLRANDRKPQNLEEVTYRGSKYRLDDNLLHQLQKLFA
jgi:ubiquitin carboxyl-terminal hydrolase 34